MLIRCPECNKEISDKAESCPHCGYPVLEIENTLKQEQISSKKEINGVQFDIEEIQKSIIWAPSVEKVAKKVSKICKCGQQEAEEMVYSYFLSLHGEYFTDSADLKNKISQIKSWKGKNNYCPYCLSTNINIHQAVHESISKGKSEVRKKSAVTRAGNKAGRAGMIMMTGGLWALTPKKSDYEEVQKGKTTYNTITTKTCADCGRLIQQSF